MFEFWGGGGGSYDITPPTTTTQSLQEKFYNYLNQCTVLGLWKIVKVFKSKITKSEIASQWAIRIQKKVYILKD